MLNIRIEKAPAPKLLPEADNPLIFGTIFTDHMFIMDYTEDNGWHDPRIIPYGPVPLEPSAMVFHYGQELFEGLKAYKAGDGRILLFRPELNAKRSNDTCERICIPTIPVPDYVQAVKELVAIDADWIPDRPGTSLYIRPFIIATDPFLGVRPSASYKFIIILSPVGAYYPEGLNPVKIWVEEEYVRAVRGGLGEAKAGANYVASLKAQIKAKEAGYSQVLWLDGIERKYVEEVGAMNIFFKINEEIITPALCGSILPGITRRSCIELCKLWGYDVSERQISADEIISAAKSGTLKEIWGTGTAAVISPVGLLKKGETEVEIGNGGIGELTQRLYDTLTGIQLGKIEAPADWVEVV
ncbi:MAG: branched-chain amino acid aminotransferase [Lachnospiraceae bacterium]|nr:branched-chain amino acid aminotransferase [Lachnospiraceae bacterium]